MPRPNRPRTILAEDHLARRIAIERERKDMSTDGLAQRMTDVGCAMTGSAIYKIEKGVPRRRITVDELVAFSQVFEVPIEDLLLPPEAVLERELARKLIELDEAQQAARASERRVAAVSEDILAFVSSQLGQPGSRHPRSWNEAVARDYIDQLEAWLDAQTKALSGDQMRLKRALNLTLSQLDGAGGHSGQHPEAE